MENFQTNRQTGAVVYPAADDQIQEASFSMPFGLPSLGHGPVPPVSTYPFSGSHFEHRLEANVYKIAVLAGADIGDYIFSLPALNSLRLAYPQAEIILLGQEWHAQFLQDRPSPVDRVIVIPAPLSWSGESGPASFELEGFFEQLEYEKFDLAIQMQEEGQLANPFVRRLGARLTVGFRSFDALPLDRWIPYSFYQLDVLRYLEVVSLVGADSVSLETRVPVIERDREEAARVVPETSRPLVVLHPGAIDERHRWPLEKFAQVGNALAWRGAQIVLTGSEADGSIVRALSSQMAMPVLDASGRLNLNGLAGLLSRASVVVANDSGTLHLAAAVGAPTVGIYWCANLMTTGPITRTRHRPAISWRVACPICGLNSTRTACEHQISFVADISKEEVTASAIDLMALGQKVPQ